ncbi:hypothetical protein CR513_28992, partial [Mucuna pruriens]
MREDRAVEGALPTKHHGAGYNKKKLYKKNQPTSSEKSYPPCQYCGKMGHPPFKCWRRPEVKCSRCNQIRHEVVICKANIQQVVVDAQNVQENVQQKNVAQVADEEEEQLFVATCFAISNSSEKWLIDNGCTNHMTFDSDLFKELDISIVSKVKIRNGEHIAVKGKDTVTIESISSTKLIKDVLFVPNISQILLSVGQLIQKGFKVIFESDQCLIKDVDDNKVFKVKMKGKSFELDSLKEEQKAFSTTAIATSSTKPTKTHSITRPPPSAGVMKDVNRKVIRRSGTHKEDTQRGCRNGSNCRYQHDLSGMSRIAKRLKEEQKAFSTTAIATSSTKPTKTHSITRPPPSAGVMKDVNRKVIRRSGTHKEDTQRGYRNDSNCRYQHDISGMSQIAKRLKLLVVVARIT